MGDLVLYLKGLTLPRIVLWCGLIGYLVLPVVRRLGAQPLQPR